MKKNNDERLKIAIPIAVCLAAVLVVLAVMQGNTASTAQEDKSTTDQKNQVLQVKADQADTLANQIAAACSAGGQTARDLQDKFGACTQATVVKQAPAPGPEGKPGSEGAPGRGIRQTDVRDGHLYVSYTDGTTEDKGQVVGADGKTPKDGRGITGTTIAAGHLVLTYTDGATDDVGLVMGKDGKDGRGVSQITITGAYHLVVTYTDGTTADVGPLPPGPQGPKGDKGDKGETGGQGNDGQPAVGWTTKKINGNTETCRRAQPFDYQQPFYECTEEPPAQSNPPLPIPTS